MILNLDENTRINLCFKLSALGTALCLQRRKNNSNSWKTVSWIYPSCLTVPTLEAAKSYLFSEEKNIKLSEKILGEKILMND